MAIAIQLESGQYLKTSSLISVPIGVVLSVIVTTEGLYDGDYTSFFSRDGVNNSYFKIFTDGRVFVQGRDTGRITLNITTPRPDITKLELKVDGVNCYLYVNDVLEDSGVFGAETRWFINKFNDTNSRQTLSSIEFITDGVSIAKIDANASDHSNGGGSAPYPQPIVVDTIGGNNATGVNFSTTDLGYWVDLGGDPVSGAPIHILTTTYLGF